MKSFQLVAPGKTSIVESDMPEPSGRQVRVKIMAAALNKRDQFIREGKYPNITFPAILGSDGCGVVDAVADPADEHWVGKEVVINPNQHWGRNPDVQGRKYSILGMPDNGTLSEYIVVHSDRLHEKPAHLSAEQAAALPLGGLTAFRACFHHGRIKAGENVLISGFGGGVAQFAFQFALAENAHVYVTSGSEKKRARALKMGAIEAYDYKASDWYKNPWKTKGGFDVVIDSAGGEQINHFIKIMRPGGRVVFYGATNGLPTSLDLYRMFWNQITLQGSTMGNDQEFEKMVEYVGHHKIVPVVDSVRPFTEIEQAIDDMSANRKSGKIVLSFA